MHCLPLAVLNGRLSHVHDYIPAIRSILFCAMSSGDPVKREARKLHVAIYSCGCVSYGMMLNLRNQKGHSLCRFILVSIKCAKETKEDRCCDRRSALRLSCPHHLRERQPGCTTMPSTLRVLTSARMSLYAAAVGAEGKAGLPLARLRTTTLFSGTGTSESADAPPSSWGREQ
jgi:hypothetical protein